MFLLVNMHWSLGEREIIGRKGANVDSDIPYYRCFYNCQQQSLEKNVFYFFYNITEEKPLIAIFCISINLQVLITSA